MASHCLQREGEQGRSRLARGEQRSLWFKMREGSREALDEPVEPAPGRRRVSVTLHPPDGSGE